MQKIDLLLGSIVLTILMIAIIDGIVWSVV
jgi:hypothetical protein